MNTSICFALNQEPGNFTIAAQLSGKVDPRTLYQALLELRYRYPIMFFADAKQISEGSHLDFPGNEETFLSVVSGRDCSVGNWVKKALDNRFDISKAPLFRCTLLEDGQSHMLIFSFHPSVGDAARAILFIGDMVKSLRGGASGCTLSSNRVCRKMDVDPRGEFGIIRAEASPLEIELKKLSVELSSIVMARCLLERSTILGLWGAVVLLASKRSDAVAGSGELEVLIAGAEILQGQRSINDYQPFVWPGRDDNGYGGFWDLARSVSSELASFNLAEPMDRNQLRFNEYLDTITSIGVRPANACLHLPEIHLTDLGRIGIGTAGGRLRLSGLWGPVFAPILENRIRVSFAMVNADLCISAAGGKGLGAFVDELLLIVKEVCYG